MFSMIESWEFLSPLSIVGLGSTTRHSNRPRGRDFLILPMRGTSPLRHPPARDATIKSMRPLLLAIVLLSWLLSSPMLAQRRRGEELDILNAAVATFDGTLRLLGKKELVLELAGGQSLTIEVNKKTRYLRGTKTISSRDVKIGSLVLVEARKVMNRLEAVTLRVKDPEP